MMVVAALLLFGLVTAYVGNVVCVAESNGRIGPPTSSASRR